MNNYFLSIVCLLLLLISCKTRNIDHIVYYNKINDIDSVYRFHHDTSATIKNCKKLFRKYGVHNQERLREFETYILLSHLKGKNFGGKKSLYELIDIITPNKYWYKDFSFFKYYGIDSLEVLRRISTREKKYNKILNDSFQIAFYRDQHFRRNGYNDSTILNDKKNIQLLRRSLKNIGFPSPAVIGPLKGYDQDIQYLLLSHVVSYKEDYLFYKEELFKHLKSGHVDPRDYAEMIDKYNTVFLDSAKSQYALWNPQELPPYDTLKIDKNRKFLGLRGLKHNSKVPKTMKQILVIK